MEEGQALSRRRNTLFVLTAVFLSVSVSVLIAEGFLRLVGFQYVLRPVQVQFGYPDPQELQQAFIADPDLLWVRRGYDDKVEYAKQNPPAMLLIGGSCTAVERWDEALIQILAAEGAENPPPTLANFGVSGWSSFQGLRQLERDVVQIRPKMITVFFGWNDHWYTFGVADKEIAAFEDHYRWLMKLRDYRVVQLAQSLYMKGRSGSSLQRQRRVSLSDFRSNISSMVRIARDNEIIPVLITAPTSHRRGHEPEYLAQRFMTDLDELVPVHQAYVEVVREVARSEDVPIVDLARLFDKMPYETVRDRYISGDGIHYEDAGNKKIAEILYEHLIRYDLVDVLR